MKAGIKRISPVTTFLLFLTSGALTAYYIPTKNSIFITSDTRQFDQADPDEEPTSETSSMNRGNGDYSQVCGAETTVPLYLLVKMMHLLNPVALLPSQKSTITTSNLS